MLVVGQLAALGTMVFALASCTLGMALATSLGRCCSSLGPAGFGGTVSALAFGFVEGGGGCLGGVLGCWEPMKG